MTRLVLALLLALLPLPAVADALRALTLRQDMLGWEGVGRLAFGRDGYCTGALVAPDIVLTAAHCLFEDGTPRARETITFRAGDRAGEVIAERGIVQAAVPEDYLAGRDDPARRVAADVALLRLDAPIPSGTARSFRVDPAIPRGAVSVVSYGAGRDAVPSRQARCNVLGRQGATLALDCDVTFGSSGAPVFRADGTDLRIVSIVAAGGSQSGQSLAFGPVLDGRIAELTARLWSGAGVWQDAPTTARRIEPGPARAAGGARFVRP